MEEKSKNYFEVLNSVNVQEKVEKKNGLNYLSWAWAWGEVKKLHPDANYTVYEREAEYGAVNYFTDGKTCWVKTGVTINGIEHIEELPVLDLYNRSIPLEKITSFDVNKAIQRSLTKAIGRHGLGLYLYAGEDLPEEEKKANKEQTSKAKEEKKPVKEIRATANQITVLSRYYKGSDLEKLLELNGIKHLEELSIQKASELIKKINERGKENEQCGKN